MHVVCIRIYVLRRVGQDQYNIAEYVIGWHFKSLDDGEKLRIISNHFRVVHQ